MTSRLLRKPPTTVPGPISPARRAASLAVSTALLLLGAARAGESNYSPLPVAPVPAQWSPAPLVHVQQASSLVATSGIIPARYQERLDEPRTEYEIQLEPPGLERLSRLDSDMTLQERIRQETKRRDKNEVVTFPESPILSRETYKGRGPLWESRPIVVEANFTNYHRLFFEGKNAERYGWELGPLQPLFSGAWFYIDVALFPMHLGNALCLGFNESSAGYCLPGDATPLLFYTPEVTLTGTVLELGAIALLIAAFP